MKNNDDTILEILQGHRTARWPSARLVKIFIASTRSGKTFCIKLTKLFVRKINLLISNTDLIFYWYFCFKAIFLIKGYIID